MTLVLGFGSFIVFSLLVRLSVDLALWLAFATAFTIGIRAFLHFRELRFLDASSTALFGFLAIFRGFVEPGLPVTAVRLVVDASLLAVVIASLIARQPVTIQYSRQDVPRQIWESRSFVRANYMLTTIWAGAFAVMAFVDGAATFNPNVPLTYAVATSLLALAGALILTWRSPVLSLARSRPDAKR
jgi:hypothetical protein